MLCGCISIVLIFNGVYTYASVMIFVAAVFDFLDGTAARLLNAKSDIGKQLDSLSDVVSFGVAPAGILYVFMANASPFSTAEFLELSAVPAFLIAVFSALRLARFNIDDSQTYSFKGLPTPANALFIACLPFIHLESDFDNSFSTLMNGLTTNYFILLVMTFILSVLLVSNIPLMSLKTKSLHWKHIRFKVVFLILALIMLIIAGFYAAPLLLLIYIAISLVENFFYSD